MHSSARHSPRAPQPPWSARPPEPADLADRDATVVLVDDPLRALQAVATAWRALFDPLVVGITGSIAKTSTKEAVAAVLGAAMPTLKNEGNLNNEIGLPLTVLRLGPEHRAAVLEMGMYVGGEIADLARIGRPEIGIVTAVQPVHLSRIGTIEAVERAKGELVEALPADGVAILNADDERVRRDGGADDGHGRDVRVRADRRRARRAGRCRAGADGMRFDLVTASGRRPVTIPTLGRLAVHNALAAAAVGLAAGLSLDAVRRGARRRLERAASRRSSSGRAGSRSSTTATTPRRARWWPRWSCSAGCPAGGSPFSARCSSWATSTWPDTRESARPRPRSWTCWSSSGPGQPASPRARERPGWPRRRVIQAADRVAARDRLLELLRPGDVVLVKASRGIALDVLVDELVATLGPDAR